MKFFKKIVTFEIKEEFMGLAGGLFTIIIAVLGYLATLKGVRSFSNSSIGPVTIPRITCGVICVLGIIQILKWIRNYRKQEHINHDVEEPEISDEELRILAYRKFTPIVSFLIIALYIYMMKSTGFVIASTVFLTLEIPLLSMDLSVKSFLKAFLLGLSVSAVVFLIFAKGFQLRLPKGKWGF